MTDPYVELHAASAFSFLEGASQPEDLIQRAVELEMPAIALLDRNGLYGAARFHTSASEMGYGLILEQKSLYRVLVTGSCLRDGFRIGVQRNRRGFLCCANRREGYQNLCQLITQFKMREQEKCEGAATREDLQQYSSGLVCLTGGDEGPLAAALVSGGEMPGVKL